MLALTRRDGEAIQIGDDITVHVVRSESGRVRVAIDAPREIRIERTVSPPRPHPQLHRRGVKAG